MNIILLIIVNAIFLSILLAFSHGLLKWVAIQDTDSYIHTLYKYWWAIGGAIGIYVFIFFYYAYILKSMPINILYPIYTGLSIILVFIIGVLIFSEPVSSKQIFGCVLIVAGIVLVVGVDAKL